MHVSPARSPVGVAKIGAHFCALARSLPACLPACHPACLPACVRAGGRHARAHHPPWWMEVDESTGLNKGRESRASTYDTHTLDWGMLCSCNHENQSKPAHTSDTPVREVQTLGALGVRLVASFAGCVTLRRQLAGDTARYDIHIS
jgi:hypothetical protein